MSELDWIYKIFHLHFNVPNIFAKMDSILDKHKPLVFIICWKWGTLKQMWVN